MTQGSEAEDPVQPRGGEQGSHGDGVRSGLEDVERQATNDWVREHLPEMRRSAYGQRSLYWALGVAFVVGLGVYAGGYALKTSVTTEPLAFLGDLLYALGWALWTGVVVVLFLQVLPEAKRRQYKRFLEGYEAMLRDKARSSDEATRRRYERLLADYDEAAKRDDAAADETSGIDRITE
jgi:hypothetical protein